MSVTEVKFLNQMQRFQEQQYLYTHCGPVPDDIIVSKCNIISSSCAAAATSQGKSETLVETRKECLYPNCVTTSTLYPYFCDEHAVEIYGLQIAPSTIEGAGNGLFATRNFEKDENITLYVGTCKSIAQVNAEAEQNSEQGRYIFSMQPCSDPRVPRINVDARSTQSTVGRWINDSRDVLKNNVVFKSYCPEGKEADSEEDKLYVLGVFAKRDICAGEELFASYGKHYWNRNEQLK